MIPNLHLQILKSINLPAGRRVIKLLLEFVAEFNQEPANGTKGVN